MAITNNQEAVVSVNGARFAIIGSLLAARFFSQGYLNALA